MFFIRVAFWLGLVVLLLPTDERQQAKLYGTAVATVERVTTFCDRNAQLCVAGADFWATFVKKAEFGARMAVDLVSSGSLTGRERIPPNDAELRYDPRHYAPARGTLTPDDLSPPWRGQVQRTRT